MVESVHTVFEIERGHGCQNEGVVERVYIVCLKSSEHTNSMTKVLLEVCLYFDFVRSRARSRMSQGRCCWKYVFEVE